MIHKCPTCKKRFDVLWPTLWRYKRKDKYLCSWSCLMAYDEKKKEQFRMSYEKRPHMRPQDTAAALKLWREGGDIDAFLTEHGITNIPKWKANARKRKPTECPEQLPAVKLTGPVRIETPEGETLAKIDVPEAPRIVNKPGRPATCDGFTVRAIEGEFGTYLRYKTGETSYIDYTSNGGEEVSMTVDQWIRFVAELDRAFSALGVEL